MCCSKQSGVLARSEIASGQARVLWKPRRAFNVELHEESNRRLRFDGTRRDLKLEGLRQKRGVTLEVYKDGCRNGLNARVLVLQLQNIP